VKCGEQSTIMLVVDLDESPRTLRFFANGKEYPFFVTYIPNSINFAVCRCSLPVGHPFAAGLFRNEKRQLLSLPPRAAELKFTSLSCRRARSCVVFVFSFSTVNKMLLLLCSFTDASRDGSRCFHCSSFVWEAPVKRHPRYLLHVLTTPNPTVDSPFFCLWRQQQHPNNPAVP
jgi:hypothetical protein